MLSESFLVDAEFPSDHSWGMFVKTYEHCMRDNVYSSCQKIKSSLCYVYSENLRLVPTKYKGIEQGVLESKKAGKLGAATHFSEITRHSKSVYLGLLSRYGIVLNSNEHSKSN